MSLTNEMLTPEFSVCSICLEDNINFTHSAKSTSKCSHIFCTNCLFNYISQSILQGKVKENGIICPESGCKEFISNSFVSRLIENDTSLLNKYSKLKYLSYIKSSNNLRECIRPNCLGVMKADPQNICLKCSICKK